jgi:hypothetical protein
MTDLARPVDDQIAQWRAFVRTRQVLHASDLDELETHLRDQVEALTDAGLADDEAFLVAVKRMGNLDALSREFARAHSERLWKQLVVASNDEVGGATDRSTRADALVALGFAIAAGAAIKVPALFGLDITEGVKHPFYAHNMSLFVLPLLALYFVWKRRLAAAHSLSLALPFVAGAACINAYPFTANSSTSILAAMHLPIALWFMVGLAYVRAQWFTDEGRMHFVRFTGELAIYVALIGLGGIVLIAFTVMMFDAIHLKADTFIGGWLVPCGAMGAVIIAAWLVEAKQSVVENMAPVLTRLFTPLFALLLLAFLGTMVWTGSPITVERNVLIGFDLLLVLVVALVLYATSARDPLAPPDFFDRLQLLLVLSALTVDGVALAAIGARISEFGFTPNRVAALGENLILLVNLAWSAWLYAAFIRGRGTFGALEAWQVRYLPVYAVWAAVVVIVFPIVFAFR